MGSIDHHLIRLAAFDSQRGEYSVEDTHAAPADEPAVDCIRRTLCRRPIAPSQTVADHQDKPADDPPIIDLRNPVRQWKYASIRRICACNQIRYSYQRRLALLWNQPLRHTASNLMDPEHSDYDQTSIERHVQPFIIHDETTRFDLGEFQPSPRPLSDLGRPIAPTKKIKLKKTNLPFIFNELIP
jgi:hypothetical protein